MRGWLDEGLDPVPVSVNLSRVHLQNPQFLERFRDIVEQYALPAGLLELELTESAVFDNVEVLRRLMHTLREAGFMPVSYTHLDVYKRQSSASERASSCSSPRSRVLRVR